MTTTKVCPTCERNWPPHLMRPVPIDEMGNPNTTMTVCPQCARHALTNNEQENN